MAGVATVLATGGMVADVGCGYGTPTLAIAGLFPSAQVLGVDYHDASIAHSRAEAARSGVGNVRFEVAAAAGLPGQGYDLITFFDSLHDIGDPLGALVRARAAVAPAGAVLLFEPLGADDVQDNLNPNGRMFYAVSTLACTPNAVSQKTPTFSEPLGAQAGEKRLRVNPASARQIVLVSPLTPAPITNASSLGGVHPGNIPAASALQPGRTTAALQPGGSRSASAGGERVVDVEVAGGAIRGDGHAVPGQQRVVVDDREVGRGEADLVAEQCRAGLGPVEVMSVAGAQGRGG
jgi:SAM-dependent methyltransferase